MEVKIAGTICWLHGTNGRRILWSCIRACVDEQVREKGPSCIRPLEGGRPTHEAATRLPGGAGPIEGVYDETNILTGRENVDPIFGPADSGESRAGSATQRIIRGSHILPRQQRIEHRGAGGWGAARRRAGGAGGKRRDLE